MSLIETSRLTKAKRYDMKEFDRSQWHLWVQTDETEIIFESIDKYNWLIGKIDLKYLELLPSETILEKEKEPVSKELIELFISYGINLNENSYIWQADKVYTNNKWNPVWQIDTDNNHIHIIIEDSICVYNGDRSI